MELRSNQEQLEDGKTPGRNILVWLSRLIYKKKTDKTELQSSWGDAEFFDG